MIIKDKKKKRELDRVPDVDDKGDPIFKIADMGENLSGKKTRLRKNENDRRAEDGGR